MIAVMDIEKDPENNGTDKSRTQKKKEAAALQKLGEELALLPAVKLRQMNLPKDLETALIEAKSITSNVAARRHRQFIGTLMRDVDPEPVREAMARVHDDATSGHQKEDPVTAWVDRLLTGEPAAIEDFMALFPHTDRQRLRQLVRNAVKAKTSGRKAAKPVNVLKDLVSQYHRQ